MKNNPAKFRFTSRGVNEARGGLILLAAGPVRSKKKVGKKKSTKKSRRTRNTPPRNP